MERRGWRAPAPRRTAATCAVLLAFALVPGLAAAAPGTAATIGTDNAGPATTTTAKTTTAQVKDPASYVNPFVGTGSGGAVVGQVDTFPGADVPFGMLQWSPDTPSRPAGGGYNYADKDITGFSLTHLSGPGCAIAGDIPVLPMTGAVPQDPTIVAATCEYGLSYACAFERGKLAAVQFHPEKSGPKGLTILANFLSF